MRSVENASICFYGQKVDNLLSLYENGFLVHLRDRLNTAIERGHEVTTRLYNLGGIPMMMTMVDKLIIEAHGIDAVVELRGQRAHDVVPGAFIAAHAGAALCRLDGADCTLTMLEELLLRPAAVETRLSYVITGTQTLATELCRLVTGTEA